MQFMINHALGFPHLLMALGYAALLVLAAPALLASRPGQRLEGLARIARQSRSTTGPAERRAANSTVSPGRGNCRG